MSRWRVGLVCNTKANTPKSAEGPADSLAEFDSLETVEALKGAIEAAGHQVTFLEANEGFLDEVREVAPDICFNIAEGLRGDSRESQIPAVLEMLGIPYSGARVIGHAISLDKAATKRMWRDNGLPTASFQVFLDPGEAIAPELEYPLFVKPLREGTGMGINKLSIVRDEAGLRRQLRWVIQTYRQPALVETFLPGREFTVGVIGNLLLPGDQPRNDLYDERGFHVFPVLEIDSNIGAGDGTYNVDAKSFVPGEEGAPLYHCPADIPVELESRLKELAIAGFLAVGGLDLSRVDFRLGADGKPYLMEINTLPGLNPIVSDMCIMAAAEGLPYERLIQEVLELAAERAAREGLLLSQPADQPTAGR